MGFKTYILELVLVFEGDSFNIPIKPSEACGLEVSKFQKYQVLKLSTRFFTGLDAHITNAYLLNGWKFLIGINCKVALFCILYMPFEGNLEW